jgi:protein-disulfide isomerase
VYPALRREFVESGIARLAYVNFPLPNHRHALPAAEVAMCAGLQGKFWEMHDALFDTQTRWAGAPNASAIFDSLARSRSVDVGAMRECITSGTLRPLIDADAARAREAGVSGTPAFIIGGDVMLQGMQPIEAFRSVISQKLGAANSGSP